MEEQINCKWLNKTYGEKYWICNGQLRKAKCNDIETEIRLNAKIRAYEELLEERKENECR